MGNRILIRSDGTIADIGAYYYDQTFEDNNPNIHFVLKSFLLYNQQ